MQPPYVTAWSGETGYAVRPSKLLGGTPALFRRDGMPGLGEPEWGIMSEERQRECALRRRCQVCHRPLRLAGHAYNLVPTRPILGMPSTNEPLTCSACVPSVLRYCPGVRRHIDDGNEELNAALLEWPGSPPVGFCQIMFTRFAPVTEAELREACRG